MSQTSEAPQGQRATRLLARPKVIATVLLRQSPVFLVLLAPPLLCALLEREWQLSLAIGGPALLVVLSFISANGIRIPDDLRHVEAVLALVLMFVLSGALTGPAFVVLGMGPIDAIFEATSAITTTGLSVARNAGSWPISAHVLRAWMQWCGGLTVAIAGLALLLDRGQTSRILGSVDIDNLNILSSTRAHARQMLIVYSGLSAFGIFGALLLVPGYWEGPVLALAAVSTGGFAPRADSLASYSLAAQAFVTFLSVLGSASLVFYVIALKKGPAAAWQATTVRSYFKVIGLSVMLYSAAHIALSDFGPGGLAAAVLTALSAQTTTGFTVGVLPHGAAFLLLLIGAMVIGGDVGSTAGGLKIGRARTLAGTIGLVMLRLATPPKALTYLKLQGERVPDDRVVFAAALLLIYLVTAFALWIAFAAAGHPPLAALFDIVSALSTVGLSAGVVGPDLSAPLKLLIAAAMLLGRLEFFGVIILFLPVTWRRRR